MKTIKYIFAISFVFSAIGCNNKKADTPLEPEEEITHTDSVATVEHIPFKLEAFASSPDTIDGCSGIFWIDGNKKNRLFYTNVASFGIIQVNGQQLFLERDSVKSMELPNGDLKEHYSGNGYDLNISLKKRSQADELGKYSGKLKVKKDQDSLEVKVDAEIGC